MTAPKGYVFHYFNDKFHIEKSERCPGVTVCGALIRYNRGTVRFESQADGRRVCQACKQQAKAKQLSRGF